MTERQWFLVTVSLAWDPAGGADRPDLGERLLDLLLDHDEMAGAKIGAGSGPAALYYRIDVYAANEVEARERAVVPAGEVAETLGGTVAVTAIQLMNEAELGEYQRRIRYHYAVRQPPHASEREARGA